MILLNPKLNENFEKEKSNMIAETDCVKVFNEEYIEVFSPTVFETVEVYTSSSSSDQSENQDFNSDIAFLETSDCNSMEASNELIDSMDTVSSLENLEPGTYTLDVLESNDFDFDTVFVNSNFSQEEPKKCKQRLDSSFQQNEGTENKEKKLKTFEETCKRYKLRNTYKNSVRKPLATKYPVKNVTAREFLNNFSDDLRKSEKSHGKKDETEEGRSLSWLLDFKISSIFHPVEKEAEIPEKTKKNSNDTQKKPRYTYTELIEQALKENGELTVSGIYNWISKHYPYYQQHDDRWKNSVRHNLSINPQFRKGKKASQGAGHFWNISETISQNNSERISNHIINKDLAKAVSNPTCGLINQIDEEVLAATKSIQESENMDFTDVSLHDAAEQIHLDGKHMESTFVNITRNDIEQLWESTNEGDSRFSSFSPLIREISEESSNAIEEENFLIQDIHNSICLGDELFTNGLNSPYYGLTTI